MIITFSGPSGAGKTTLIKELLKTDIFKGKNVIVKQEDDFIVIKAAKWLLGEKVFTKYKDEWYFNKTYDDTFYKVFKNISRICYPLVVYAEFLILYLYYEILFKDKILITDRFIYDHEISFRTLMGIQYPLFTWLYSHFPRTYLSFVLMINIENASLKRNKNNILGANTSTKVFHTTVLNLYSSIAKKHNILVIDNNKNLKGTIKQIAMHISNKKRLLDAYEIVLCGLDGAGKTTIAHKIDEYASKLNVNCAIAHFVHNNIVYKILLHFGYENNETLKNMYKRKRQKSQKERQQQTPFFVAFLRFFDSYIQYVYYQIIYWNKLIIFDRYFYDYLVSFEYLNIQPRVFFKSLIPNVKNKFLIQPNPLTSYKRKPERVKEFFLENYQIYKKVANDMNMKIINTEKLNPDDAFIKVLESLT